MLGKCSPNNGCEGNGAGGAPGKKGSEGSGCANGTWCKTGVCYAPNHENDGRLGTCAPAGWDNNYCDNGLKSDSYCKSQGYG